jgi:hypothetical protein
MVNDANIDDLLALREPAFTATAPLLKTVSAGGYSLGINTGATVTAAAFATGGFRILEDTTTLLKFQFMDTGGTNRWQNAAVMVWDVAAKGSMQIDRLRANGAAAITIDDPLLVNASVTCSALTAGASDLSSVTTQSISTSSISAADAGGLGFLTPAGIAAFSVQGDGGCRVYADLTINGDCLINTDLAVDGVCRVQDLEVAGDLIIQGATNVTAVQSGDFEMTTLANGSFTIQKHISDHAYITDGTYSAARFDVGLFGGNTFTDAIVTNIAPHVTHVSDSVFRQDLHVMGNLSCDGTSPSPFWVAGNVGPTGAVYDHKGRYAFSAVRISGDYAFDVTFPSHPDGNRYTVSTSSSEFHTMIRNQTTTGFRVYCRNASNSGTNLDGNGWISIMIIA